VGQKVNGSVAIARREFRAIKNGDHIAEEEFMKTAEISKREV